MVEAASWQSGFGLYQFFTYNDARIGHQGMTDFLTSEAACLGPGFVVETCRRQRFDAGAALFGTGILMGGSHADYEEVERHTRNYNLGSGFGGKFLAWARCPRVVDFHLRAEYMRMYTWNSYEETEYDLSKHKNAAQGDAGCVWVGIVNPTLDVRLCRQVGLRLGGDYLLRHTRYKYHPSVSSHARELRIGLWWQHNPRPRSTTHEQ